MIGRTAKNLQIGDERLRGTQPRSCDDQLFDAFAIGGTGIEQRAAQRQAAIDEPVEIRRIGGFLLSHFAASGQQILLSPAANLDARRRGNTLHGTA